MTPGSLLSRSNKSFWEEKIVYFLWYDTDRIENNASNNSFSLECVCLAAVIILPSRFLATIGGIRVQTHRLMREIYEVRVEMGSGTAIHIPSFVKIGSGVQKLIGGIHRHLYFFIKINENRPEKVSWIRKLHFNSICVTNRAVAIWIFRECFSQACASFQMNVNYALKR
jgi:hypothetical protein